MEEMLDVIFNIQFSSNFVGKLTFQRLGTTMFSIPEAVIFLLLYINNHIVASLFFARWQNDLDILITSGKLFSFPLLYD